MAFRPHLVIVALALFASVALSEEIDPVSSRDESFGRPSDILPIWTEIYPHAEFIPISIIDIYAGYGSPGAIQGFDKHRILRFAKLQEMCDGCPIDVEYINAHEVRGIQPNYQIVDFENHVNPDEPLRLYAAKRYPSVYIDDPLNW